MRECATAPYNFVSLNQQVLKSPIDGGAGTDEERQENYRKHILSKDKLSGIIRLVLKTKTPVFIGNGGGEFFGPDGKPVIPGSSIRGMVKNIFKIVTCSSMRGDADDADFNDKKLYFRTMADKRKNVRKAYTDRMSAYNPAEKKNISYAEAGFLIHSKEDQEYYMVPTDFEEKWEEPSIVQQKSPSIDWNLDGGKKIAMYTGSMRKKCHYTIHKKSDFRERIRVDSPVIEDYKMDVTRKGVSIFDQSYCKQGTSAGEYTDDKDIDFVAPCFYVEEGGQINHFGFGRYYRIPYKHSIGKLVPKELQGETVDYADAIFGRKELWGSRLSFEDAVCSDGAAAQEQPAFSRILSSPKPTSFQLYLKQDDGGEIKHWDSNDAVIRGYKMYWHKKESWKNPEQKASTVCPKTIHPVKAGQEFHGQIRFERLSREELGALLKVFELAEKDESLCYKLGQGKSIGMGSVRMEATLEIIDEESCYERLFDGQGSWNEARKAEEMSQYTEVFDKALKEGLSTEAYTRYLISQRELCHLLSWENTEKKDWNAKTEMMDIEDPDKPFQNRMVLPEACEVK